MDTPFPGDKSPFLVPYPPPAQSGPGIKPFAAIDLVPPLGQTGAAGPRMQAPQASPFLEKESGAGASGRQPSAAPSLPDPLLPLPSGSLSQVFAPSSPSASGGFPFASAPPMAPKPVPAPAKAVKAPVDFVPVPPAPAAPPISALTPVPKPAPIAPAALAAPPAPAVAVAPVAPAAPIVPVVPAAVPAPEMAAALRASATLRRGSASEIIPKSDLAMTDADTPEAPPLLVTSCPSLEGRRISSYLGVVSSEIVIPMDVLFRNPAPYGELHRIKAAEDQLQKVRRKATEELTARARALGADGIVAVALQYSQIDAVAFLCAASGTAVKLT